MSGRCTICQEIFVPSEISALKCGHTFHFHCISQWLQKPNSSCPVCRRPSDPSTVIQQLFFDYGEDSLLGTPSPRGGQSQSKQISELTKKVQIWEKQVSDAGKKIATLTGSMNRISEEVTRLRAQNARLETARRAAQASVSALQHRNNSLHAENGELEDKLKKLEAIDHLVNSIGKSGNARSDDYSAGVLQTSLDILKQKNIDLLAEKRTTFSRMKQLEKENSLFEAENSELKVSLESVKEELLVQRLKVGRKHGHKVLKDNWNASRQVDGDRSDTTLEMDDSESIGDNSRLFNIPAVKITNVVEAAAKRGRPKRGRAIVSQAAGKTRAAPKTRNSLVRWDGLGGSTSTMGEFPVKKRMDTPHRGNHGVKKSTKAPTAPKRPKANARTRTAVESDSDNSIVLLD